jgi:hypothetical protein
MISIAFLLYSPITSNRGKKPSEHVDEIDQKKKKFAGYILNNFMWNIFYVYNK